MVRDDHLVQLEEVVSRKAIDVWQQWRPGRVPTLEEQVEALTYYAVNDAWLPVG
jgi:hypothetical protein